MKKNSELLKIAYTSKAHGIKGEIFVCPLNTQFYWPQPIKKLVIGNSSFSVQNCSPHKEGMIFKLAECQSRKEAESFKNQPIFLNKNLFKSKKGDDIFLVELTSFVVEVLGQGELGRIQSFQSDRHQDLLIVQKRRGEGKVLIPFVREYIQEIHFSKKKLVLDLPQNFLEIFSYTDPV